MKEKRHWPIYKRMIYDEGTGCLQPMTSWIYNKLYVSSKVKEIHPRIGRDISFAEDSVFLYQYMLTCEKIVICHKCLYHYCYREGSAIHKVNESMLMDINKVYLALVHAFRMHWLGQELLFQLQRWVAVRACIAMNEMMGFDKRLHILEFVADLKGLDNKKLILYGAGRVGRDTYRQLKEFGYHVAHWVDKEYQYYQKQGFPVESPEEIGYWEYDRILIAIENEDVAENIREHLTEKNISKESVIWRKPLKLY